MNEAHHHHQIDPSFHPVVGPPSPQPHSSPGGDFHTFYQLQPQSHQYLHHPYTHHHHPYHQYPADPAEYQYHRGHPLTPSHPSTSTPAPDYHIPATNQGFVESFDHHPFTPQPYSGPETFDPYPQSRSEGSDLDVGVDPEVDLDIDIEVDSTHNYYSEPLSYPSSHPSPRSVDSCEGSGTSQFIELERDVSGDGNSSRDPSPGGSNARPGRIKGRYPWVGGGGSDFEVDVEDKMEPEGEGGSGVGDVDVATIDETSGDEDSSSTGSRPLSERNGKSHKSSTTSLASPDPKLCGVCGDKALGNNFNAITCESCKAFFRRNALRPKEFVCPFNDSCKVDPVTRRFCQKCRLKKCFDIGMKKEWIMTDEEKKMKKAKIEQNRLKRASSSDVREGDPTNPKERAVAGVGDHEHDLDHLLPPPPQGCSDASNSNSSEGPNFGELVPQPQAQAMLMPQSNHISVPVHGQNPATPTVAPTDIRNGHGNRGIGSIDQIVAAASILQQQQQQQQHHSQIHYNGGGGDHNFVEESASAQPQHPILASLVRPGLPDSPPEGLPVHPQPHPHDSDYPTKKKTLIQQYNMEMTHHGHGHTQLCPDEDDFDQHSSSTSPPQLTQHHTHYLDYIHSSSSSPSKGGGGESDLPPLPLNTMESILSVAISAEFNAFGFNDDHHPHTHGGSPTEDPPSAHSPPPISHHSCGTGSRGALSPNSRSLNKAEKAKLSELFFASEALNAPVDLDGPIKIATSDPSLINVINLTDIAIRRLIKMSKKLYAFKNMCQEDQIALLKGGCTEMMILRSVVSYDPERDSWNIPHSNGFNVKLGVLKEARGNLYEQHQRFVKSFKGEWRGDYNIMIILCAITLFTPERPNVIHKDVVKLEQDSYYYLLKRYLESTRNGCEARSTYLQLIQRIAELHILNSNHLRVFLEVNPREVEPLLIEIFDLKQ